jgi:hypothetical protein
VVAAIPRDASRVPCQGKADSDRFILKALTTVRGVYILKIRVGTTVAQTIYTDTLARAAELHGSTQSLANFLHVPEATLLRWMSGRAQMPLRAFVKLIEVVAQSETARPSDPVLQENPQAEPLTFRIGSLLARCARCDRTEFVAAGSKSQTRFTAKLACRACGEQVIHSDLISRLAKDAVRQPRASRPARQARQADLPGRSPKHPP